MDRLEHWHGIFERQLAALWSDEDDGSHDIGHVRRVWANCRRIDAGEPRRCRPLVLLAAAWFHDVVPVPKSDPARSRASRRSAARADALLDAHGWARERRDAVAHAIEAHSFSAGIAPLTREARVLQDADRLDALGAIGIARTFMVAGRLHSALLDPDDPFARARPADDRRYAFDHFPIKLLGLADTMQTVTGRALAAARTATLQAFLETAEAEMRGER